MTLLMSLKPRSELVEIYDRNELINLAEPIITPKYDLVVK